MRHAPNLVLRERKRERESERGAWGSRAFEHSAHVFWRIFFASRTACSPAFSVHLQVCFFSACVSRCAERGSVWAHRPRTISKIKRRMLFKPAIEPLSLSHRLFKAAATEASATASSRTPPGYDYCKSTSIYLREPIVFIQAAMISSLRAYLREPVVLQATSIASLQAHLRESAS